MVYRGTDVPQLVYPVSLQLGLTVIFPSLALQASRHLALFILWDGRAWFWVTHCWGEGCHTYHSHGSHRDVCFHQPLIVMVLCVEKIGFMGSKRYKSRFAKPAVYLFRSFGNSES